MKCNTLTLKETQVLSDGYRTKLYKKPTVKAIRKTESKIFWKELLIFTVVEFNDYRFN